MNISSELGREYWVGRGLTEETIRNALLGYYPPLERYTIPYFQKDGSVSNISFRASREGQDPKYIRVPGVGSEPYRTGSFESKQVVITEGEVDALVVHQELPDTMALGLPGATLAKDSLLAYIPAGARVIAVMDRDGPGKRAEGRLRVLIPGLLGGQLPEGVKDINELLQSLGASAIQHLIESAVEHSPSADSELAVPSTTYLTLPDNTTRWLIEDLWMDQALGFVAGIPKAMKSTLALHLGYHVSMDKAFAGKAILRPGPVLLVQEEDNDHVIKSRLRSINSGMGSPDLYIRTPGTSGVHFRVDDDGSLEYLDETIRRLQPVLVILDPLANMHTLEDENNAGSINKILERLRHIRDLRKTSILVVHHLRKGLDDGEDATGQRMRGSSVFHAKSECALYIAKHGNTLRVTVENKISPTRIVELNYTGKEFVMEEE